MVKQKYPLKKIKEHLQAQPSLHFRGLTKTDADKNVEKFLQNLLIYNNKYDTYQGNTLQTPRGKRRSIGDLYRICFYYFPKITITHVYQAILECITNGKAVSAICKLTKMRVYRASISEYEKSFFNGDATDEFGVDISKFEGFASLPKGVGGWGVEYTVKDLQIIELK